MKFKTQAIHIGNEPNYKDGGFGDVVTPIHLSTTFARKKVDKPTAGLEYSRTGNPTRHALEKNLAALEHGSHAYAFSSGLSAITTVLLTLKKGDHVVSIDDVYGGTRRLFARVFGQFGIDFSFIDFSHGSELEEHICDNTKLIWIETPTNPLLKIVDIASVARVAKKHRVVTVVDNTFASPYFQNPLDLGADIVLHSLTKYIGGHGDVVGGAVIVNDQNLAEKIQFLQNAAGAILSPFDSYQALKGIKTLAIRMRQHEENAQKLVEYLSTQKKVRKIYYPGLDTHKGHKIAKAQMRGFGAMVSLELAADFDSTVSFLESLSIFKLAESLGSVESLIEHPASMTHAAILREDREKIGLTDTLIRISVGIEDVADLIADIDQALQKV